MISTHLEYIVEYLYFVQNRCRIIELSENIRLPSCLSTPPLLVSIQIERLGGEDPGLVDGVEGATRGLVGRAP